MMNLKNIKVVRFNDYSEYEEGNSNNGGCYGFWTEYTRVVNGWEVSYGTTADFPYCTCCGCFNDHYDYDKNEYTCGDFEVISTGELEEKIKSFESCFLKDDGYSIEYIR